jgi:hypothetical protein
MHIQNILLRLFYTHNVLNFFARLLAFEEMKRDLSRFSFISLYLKPLDQDISLILSKMCE